MSLRTKFVLLLTTVGVAVAVMLGMAFWSFSVLDREMGGSLESIESVLGGLNRLKRTFWDQAELLGESSFPTGQPSEDPERSSAETRLSDLAEFNDLAAQAQRVLTHLEGLDSYKLRSGVSRTRALREGANEAASYGRRWLETGDPESLRLAGESLYMQHERIEAIEREILADAHAAVGFGDRLQSTITLGLVSSAAVVFIAGMLATVLVHRWVLRPVALLREAAVRIGAGDFAHRVPVDGRDEVSQLSAEVNHMAEMVATLQDDRVERERFAAVGEMAQKLVHNIRGPLGGIRTLAELTEQKSGNAELVRDTQHRIVGTVDRFEAWIGELLGATRPLEVSLERVEVEPWLTRLVEFHRTRAETREVAIRLEVNGAPKAARFDPRLVEQALAALVSNALEVSPSGATVGVRAEGGDRGDLWRVTVADEGPGVPGEVVERIFQPYFTTKRAGTGIGLALARRVAEQHGGRLWLKAGSRSENGHESSSGATFVLELPVTPEDMSGQ